MPHNIVTKFINIPIIIKLLAIVALALFPILKFIFDKNKANYKEKIEFIDKLWIYTKSNGVGNSLELKALCNSIYGSNPNDKELFLAGSMKNINDFNNFFNGYKYLIIDTKRNSFRKKKYLPLIFYCYFFSMCFTSSFGFFSIVFCLSSLEMKGQYKSYNFVLVLTFLLAFISIFLFYKSNYNFGSVKSAMQLTRYIELMRRRGKICLYICESLLYLLAVTLAFIFNFFIFYEAVVHAPY